ncbi:MAG: amine dehydrogenase large subunit [Polyangiales bacterium]
MMLRRASISLLWAGLLSLGVLSMVRADVSPDAPGQVATLPDAVGDHWVWVPDRALRRSVLFDGDSGDMLGLIDSGMSITPKAPQWSKKRGEIYSVDTIYTRGHHGERQDFVFIYDARTLDVKGEISIPPRSADTSTGVSLLGMLDGERFLVVLNHAPGSSVSVVDLEARAFVEEIQTAGCAGVYPAGDARFGMLCGDGTAITVTLNGAGALERIGRSDPFFDVIEDPVSEKGARDGARWLYTSFEGLLHTVDYAGDAPVVLPSWSLFDDDQRRRGWRAGGGQYLAYHPPSKRLYVIVHEGGPGSHKDPGSEVWVYDTVAQQRVATFSMPNELVAFIRPQIGFEAGGFTEWLLSKVLPNLGVHSVAVTQDDAPLLFVRHADLGAVGVLDAQTGAHLRDLDEVGLSGILLVVP